MSTTIQVALLLLLAIIALMLYRALRGGLMLRIDDATRRLREAAAHYGDVNAVAELTKQLKNNPELMQRLSTYPQQVVAAALAHRVNAIGNDLKVAQRELSKVRERFALPSGEYLKDTVARLEKLVDHLLEELQEASDAAEEFNSSGVMP